MSVRAGAMFENLFASEALRRNLDVSRPDHHLLPFDLIVSNTKGKLFRVQVKGTSTFSRGGGFSFTTRRGFGSEIDLFVGIVERPGDRIFYIIPSDKLSETASCVRVFPTPKSKAKFEKYRNAWEFFNL